MRGVLLITGAAIAKVPAISCDLPGGLIGEAHHQWGGTRCAVQIESGDGPCYLGGIGRDWGRGLILHADIVNRDIPPFSTITQENPQPELINAVLDD